MNNTPFRSSAQPLRADVSSSVADRLIDEGLISLVTAAAMLPPIRGKRVSTSSVLRWIFKGKSGVRLEGIRLHGSGWFTSRQAMARFASALTHLSLNDSAFR